MWCTQQHTPPETESGCSELWSGCWSSSMWLNEYCCCLRRPPGPQIGLLGPAKVLAASSPTPSGAIRCTSEHVWRSMPWGTKQPHRYMLLLFVLLKIHAPACGGAPRSFKYETIVVIFLSSLHQKINALLLFIVKKESEKRRSSIFGGVLWV